MGSIKVAYKLASQDIVDTMYACMPMISNNPALVNEFSPSEKDRLYETFGEVYAAYREAAGSGDTTELPVEYQDFALILIACTACFYLAAQDKVTEEINSRSKTSKTSSKPPRTDFFNRGGDIDNPDQSTENAETDPESGRSGESPDDAVSSEEPFAEDAGEQPDSDSSTGSEVETDAPEGRSESAGTEPEGSSAEGTSEAVENTPGGRNPEAEEAARKNKHKSLRGLLDENEGLGSDQGTYQKGCSYEGMELEETVEHYHENCLRCLHFGECRENGILILTRNKIDFEITFKQEPHRVMGIVCPFPNAEQRPVRNPGEHEEADDTTTGAATEGGVSEESSTTETTPVNENIANEYTVTACRNGDSAQTADDAAGGKADPDEKDTAEGGSESGNNAAAWKTAEKTGSAGAADLTEGIMMCGSFPSNLTSSTNYGSSIRATALLLHCFGFVSLEKSRNVMSSFMDRSFAKGDIPNYCRSLRPEMEKVNERIRNALWMRELIHLDETGTHIDGTLAWLHVACDAFFTYVSIQSERGWNGIDAAGFLEYYEHKYMTDCWQPYDGHGLDPEKHARCCSHLLRELLGVALFFSEDTEWAGQMIIELVRMNKLRNEYKAKGLTEFPQEVKDAFYSRMHALIDEGLKLHPVPERQPGQRGKVARGKVGALLDRIQDKLGSFCMFVEDFTVPFSNNIAERAFRCLGVRDFRSEEGPYLFMLIWSYIDSCRKHGLNVYDALIAAFEGRAVEFLFGDNPPERPESVDKAMDAKVRKMIEEGTDPYTAYAERPNQKGRKPKRERIAAEFTGNRVLQEKYDRMMAERNTDSTGTDAKDSPAEAPDERWDKRLVDCIIQNARKNNVTTVVIGRKRYSLEELIDRRNREIAISREEKAAHAEEVKRKKAEKEAKKAAKEDVEKRYEDFTVDTMRRIREDAAKHQKKKDKAMKEVMANAATMMTAAPAAE